MQKKLSRVNCLNAKKLTGFFANNYKGNSPVPVRKTYRPARIAVPALVRATLLSLYNTPRLSPFFMHCMDLRKALPSSYSVFEHPESGIAPTNQTCFKLSCQVSSKNGECPELPPLDLTLFS
ncbi:MAG: hypothetical protein JXN60_05720 [Lentisphaerae bacterium]|nr:hypothetical protein [Lentisphaerota bacterium]